MSTLYLHHPAALDHQTPLGHPERPDRIRAGLVREAAPRASAGDITLAHPEDYVRAIAEAAPREGLVRIDADTSMSPGSYEAILRGAGAAVKAVTR